MKKISFFLGLFALGVWFYLSAPLLPSLASGPGDAFDDFDGYTDGAEVNSLSGGVGWDGNWSHTGGAGDYNVVEKPTFDGARAAHAIRNGTGTGGALRAIDLGSHILYHAAVRQDVSSTTAGVRIQAYTGTLGTEYDIHLDSGNIVLKSDDGDVTLMPFTANKWYEVELEIDSASYLNRARAREEGGAYTDWTNWIHAWAGTETSAPAKVTYAVAGSDVYDAYVDDLRVYTVQ